MKKHKFITISYEWVRRKRVKLQHSHMSRTVYSGTYQKVYKMKCKNCGMTMKKGDHPLLKFNDWRDDCTLVIAFKIHGT